MRACYYRIANHLFAISLPKVWNIETLFPTLKPFEATPTATEEILFSLTFSPIHTPMNMEEMISFEWDDASCNIRQTANEYLITILPFHDSVEGQMLVDKHFTHATVEATNHEVLSSFVAGNFLMMLFAFATAPHGTLMFHASVIRRQGYGYLFLGKSGTGKSTHSRLWLEHIPDTDLLNDDNPIVRIYPTGEVIVYGSPWSGKTPCYRNEEVPVGAIVRLKQAPHNQIQQEKTVQAFASILPSCSCLRQDKRLFDALCDTVSRIATSTPVYLLECLPNQEAAFLCHQTIRKA
ncbi:hypothetical protein [Bacteroides sp. 224]|uniref:hypothetical protein n=1 Tax=Bacteroides sp. 224 TaxID=2302936 RepID=UPI0013D779E7|nr:hypothetical protein [Bacteroides sp. 224]NDV66997.1 hypothetical protein [Bacteroides sp. 224]